MRPCRDAAPLPLHLFDEEAASEFAERRQDDLSALQAEAWQPDAVPPRANHASDRMHMPRER